MALLAVACSVYDPTLLSNALIDEPSGTAGESGAAGSDATRGGAAAGSSSSGASGTAPSPAGGAKVVAAAQGGAGGEPTAEPVSGGEGGAPAVADECPADADKVTPGACGCGVPEAPSATKADCATLKSLLVHRYDFEGTGTEVQDRVGDKHGVIPRDATLSKLDGEGVVVLTGGSIGPYVDLPNGLVSSLTNATFEAWVTWSGGDPEQRIFDFGDSTASMPEDATTGGKTYLFVTPQASSGVLMAGFSLAKAAAEVDVAAAAALPQTLSQVVVVADDAADKLLLYVNGALAGEAAWTGQLSGINDVNVWLGRSQDGADVEFAGVFHEFRIYKAALSAAQVASAFNAGTDPEFLAY